MPRFSAGTDTASRWAAKFSYSMYPEYAFAGSLDDEVKALIMDFSAHCRNRWDLRSLLKSDPSVTLTTAKRSKDRIDRLRREANGKPLHILNLSDNLTTAIECGQPFIGPTQVSQVFFTTDHASALVYRYTISGCNPRGVWSIFRKKDGLWQLEREGKATILHDWRVLWTLHLISVFAAVCFLLKMEGRAGFGRFIRRM
jgi:hypothetical protein